jgi:hypothetical protein
VNFVIGLGPGYTASLEQLAWLLSKKVVVVQKSGCCPKKWLWPNKAGSGTFGKYLLAHLQFPLDGPEKSYSSFPETV